VALQIASSLATAIKSNEKLCAGQQKVAPPPTAHCHIVIRSSIAISICNFIGGLDSLDSSHSADAALH